MDPKTKSEVLDIPSGNSSQKYIRTFESDMDLSKKGGTPGFIPLREQESGAGPVASAEPAVPAIDEKDEELSIPALSVPETPPRQEPPAPVPVPVPPIERAPEPPAQPAPEESVPAPIETYSADFMQKMRETGASTATVVAAEQDAGPAPEPEEPEQRSRRVRTVVSIVAGVVLLAAGVAGVYLSYSRYLTALAPVSIMQVAPTPIFVDSREKIAGTGQALMQAIEQSVAEPSAPATVRLLQSGSSEGVFLALSLPAPGILLRNINQSGGMAGVVNADGTASPFFILSVDSYAATFSGMLSWEPTMQGDLSRIFPAYPPGSGPQPAATTTAATSTPPSSPGFVDDSVGNHDVRVYRDAAGRSVLLYGYWDPSTLIIARDPASFAEILRRLATSHS